LAGRTGGREGWRKYLDWLERELHRVGVEVRMGTTATRAVVQRLQPPSDFASARQMVDRFRPYVDLGVAHFMLDLGVVTDPAAVRRIGEGCAGALSVLATRSSSEIDLASVCSRRDVPGQASWASRAM
jgi:hypothetical protein